MATGISQVFTLAGSKGGITVEVDLSETYDALLNTSDVTVGLRVKSSSYYGYTYYLSGSVRLDGEKLVSMSSASGSHYAKITALDSYASVTAAGEDYVSSPWTMGAIAHNTDGSRVLTLDITLKGYTTSGDGASGWSVSASREITLTHIPRASTLGATAAEVGAVSMVAISRKSTDYTHSVAYSFGGLSGYLTEDGGVSDTEQKMTASGIAFLVPETFYAQIPDSPTGTCVLTCRTYCGQTQVGDAQTAAFTVTAGKTLCAPELTGVVTDCNEAAIALTGDANLLIRYVSNALCTLTAQAKNGATITERTVGGVAVEESRVIEAVEQGSVQFQCVDSRGYTSSLTVEKTLIPYLRLTANATLKRTDPTSGNALLTVTGNYYNGSFGAAENTLTVVCQTADGETVAVEAAVTENTYRAEATLSGLDYQSAHTLTVTVTDRVSAVTGTASVGKGIPVFDWGENDVCFHVPVRFEQGPLTESQDHPGCFYTLVDGELQWCNPPMELDVEYRTAQHYAGQPVYVRLFRFGVLPNAAAATVSYTDEATRTFFVTGSVAYQNDAIGSNSLANWPGITAFYGSSGGVTIRTDRDLSAYYAYVLVKYIKT